MIAVYYYMERKDIIIRRKITSFKDVDWINEYGTDINTITHLYCDRNNLTTLQYIPPNLILLSCVTNNITSLQYIPSTVKTLICSNNPLLSLRYAPLNLKTLFCDNTSLASLEYLPPNVQQVSGYNSGHDPRWWYLKYLQVNLKDMQMRHEILNMPGLINRKRIIYKTWVSYFDTPNDDDVAKHAIMLFKGLNK